MVTPSRSATSSASTAWITTRFSTWRWRLRGKMWVFPAAAGNDAAGRLLPAIRHVVERQIPPPSASQRGHRHADRDRGGPGDKARLAPERSNVLQDQEERLLGAILGQRVDLVGHDAVRGGQAAANREVRCALQVCPEIGERL